MALLRHSFNVHHKFIVMSPVEIVVLVLVVVFLAGFVLWRVFKKKDKPVHTYGKGGGGTKDEGGPLETKG